MKILGEWKDTEYPVQEILYERHTVRCLLYDHGQLVLLQVTGADDFGVRNHLETIGGGIEAGESDESALRRECFEEAGCTIKNILPLGIIIDEYNLLQRRTFSHFYYAEAEKWETERHLTTFEQGYGLKLIHLDEEAALQKLSPEGKQMVEYLVNRRDYKALIEKRKQLT